MQKVAKSWIYLRAYKPGDDDGLYHTLQIDVIEPVGAIGEAAILEEAVLRIPDTDSLTVLSKIRKLYPGKKVVEDMFQNYMHLSSPYLGFRVSVQ
jgi:hypothetical protein